MSNIMRMGKSPEFLGSWDLEELPNREITLTIARIVDEKVIAAGQSEVCTVCYWVEDAKKMILNVSNKKTLARLYKTTDTEKLKGKSVIIGIEKVKAFGDVYDALRIRPRIQVAPKQAATILCEECGKPIQAQGGMSAEQVGAYTAKKYGKCLCGACATTLAQKGAE